MKRAHSHSGKSRPFSWPGGAQLAVSLVLNYEEGAEPNGSDGHDNFETFAEFLPVSALNPQGQQESGLSIEGRDVATETVFRFGAETGLRRVLQVLEEYPTPVTVFACAKALERNPGACRSFVHRGFEIAGHGYWWTSLAGLSLDQQRETIRRTLETIREVSGQTIQGWFGRRPHSAFTPEALALEGFLYDSESFADEQPEVVAFGEQRLVRLPYSLDCNDMRFWFGHFVRAHDFFGYLQDSVSEALYASSRTAGSMLSIGIHPRVIGRPGRIGGLRRILEFLHESPDLWLATREDIALHWLEHGVHHSSSGKPHPTAGW